MRGRPVSVIVGPFPNRVRALRLALRQSQTALAQAVSMSQSQIGRIERGEQRIPPDRAEAFCRALRTTWSQIAFLAASEQETRMMEVFARLDEEHRKAVLTVAESFLPPASPPASRARPRRRPA